MKSFTKLAVTGALAGVALALSISSASAWIVCNRDGDCWHAHRRYVYRPEFGLVVHPDGWVAAPGMRINWREHPGRGYWRGGVWIAF